MKIRRWMQLLIVGIVIVIIGTIIYVVIQPRRVYTDNITEGKIYLEYDDGIISEGLSDEDVKALCDIIEGKKLSTSMVDCHFYENRQIILGDCIHLLISECGSYLYDEMDSHFTLTSKEQEKLKEILTKYGYRGY